MRTVEVKVYKYDELSEEAKERALNEYNANSEYNWSSEALESIKALARHFGGELSDYSIDWLDCGRSSLSFSMPEDLTQREVAEKLKALGTYNKKTGKGHGECKLTGVCFDEDAIDGFRAAWRSGERDLVECMRMAGEYLLQACREDYEHQLSEKSFKETCEANEYEFLENGDMA